MKELMNKASRFFYSRSLGLLVIRFAVGLVFLMHGLSKVQGLGMVEGMMMHFGLPPIVGDLIAWLEVIGGAALILGIFTRLFAVAFGIEMLVAVFLTGIERGYKPHEMEIVLMLLSFGIALAGSGMYSVFKMHCNDCGGMMCKGECKMKV